MTDFTGTTFNDHFTGTTGADDFFMGQGGNDRVSGGGGGDVFWFGSEFDGADRVDGGDGSDTLVIDDTNGAIFLAANSLKNVETINLLGAGVPTITFADGNVAAGQTMTVVVATDPGVGAFLNASQETDGNYIVHASDAGCTVFTGAGDDVIFGGNGIEALSLGDGTDTAYGGEGNDSIGFGSGLLDASDRIDGGAGTIDTVTLSGDYSSGLALDPETLTRVESVVLEGGNSYTLNFSDSGPIDADLMIVSGSALSSTDVLDFTAQRGAAHGFLVRGGSGADSIVGSKVRDELHGGGGADVLDGRAGRDTFAWDAVSDSIGGAADTIKGFDAESDRLVVTFPGLGGSVDNVDPAVLEGKLNAATFDKGLKKAIGAAQLGAQDAVLFRPDEGDLAGKYYLIVDGNNIAGYQAGKDLVVFLASPKHIDDLTLDDFGGL